MKNHVPDEFNRISNDIMRTFEDVWTLYGMYGINKARRDEVLGQLRDASYMVYSDGYDYLKEHKEDES